MSPVNAWWWAAQLVTVGVVVVGVATAELRGPRRPRQATSGSPQDNLLCLFAVSAGIEDNCNDNNNNNNNNNNPLPDPLAPVPPTQPPAPLEPASQCTCVRYWHCKDNNIQRPEGTEGGLAAAVNLKSGASILCQHPENVCCLDVDTSLPPPDNAGFRSKCGRRNPQGIGANLQGFTENQAQFGELPWMVLIRRSEKPLIVDTDGFVGGGSLIRNDVVMTAGHTVQRLQARQLVVRLGEWNLESRTEPIDYQEIPVNRVLHHPQYSARNLEYDVALLMLERPAQLGRTVDTICLPKPGQTFDGLRCITSGWGKDSFGSEGRYQQILKSLELPVVDKRSCENSLRTTHLGSSFTLHKTFMCAGGEKADVCTGDGGSSLVCRSPQDPTTYVQAGIVAWGIGCGTIGLPGVYVDVPEVVPWVNQVLAENPNFNIRADTGGI